MGDAYKTTAGGGISNLYGIAWSHPNAGGIAANLNTHGALITENGSFLAALSGSIRCRDDMRAPIYYDSNNTGYYVDPNSTSNLNGLTAGTTTLGDTRINFASGGGGYTFSANHYSMGKDIANSGWSSPHYSDLIIGYHTGIRLGAQYSGIRFYNNSPTTDANNDGNGDGGESLLMTVGGYVGTANHTDVVVNNNLFANASMRAPIFYDSNNTGYYTDPASTSFLNNCTAIRYLARASGVTLGTGNSAQLEISNAASGACNISFHREGVYGAHFGLDTDNVFSTYGWSAGGGYTSMRVGGFTVNGTGTATGDFRAPIFYDSNNTGYCCDPTGSSRLNVIYCGDVYNDLGGWFRNYGVTGLYNQSYGIHFYAGDASYWNVASNYGLRIRSSYESTIKGYVYFDSSGFGLLDSSGNWKVRTTTSLVEIYNRLDAPIMYDSNNTAYYTDPASISSMYGVAIRGDNASTDTSNQIFFWGSGNSTTSAIGFKANGGNFANPTGNGDGYNTYLTMDSDGRGWVFRRGTGGTDFTSAFTSGWILNNGVWQAQASMRAPIFYDSNNTGYYTDPASTSVLNALTLGGGTVGYPAFTSYTTRAFSTWHQAGDNLLVVVAWGGPYTNDFYLYVGPSTEVYSTVARYGDDINSNTKWSTTTFIIKKGAYFYATAEVDYGFRSYPLS